MNGDNLPRAKPINLQEKIPINYITFLIIIVILASIITTLVLKNLVQHISYYAAAYFTITTLFDVVGVDAAAIVFSSLHTSGIGFETLFPILIADGIIKIVILGFVLAGVVDLITNIHIREHLIKFRIKHSKEIIIIAGYGVLSEKLCDMFSLKKINFVVIDSHTEKRDIFLSKGYNYVFGNFTESRVLEEAGINKSNTIIFATSSDFENILGVMVARDTNSQIKIIARAAEESTIEKMHYVGANLCVVPETVSGFNIANAIIKGLR